MASPEDTQEGDAKAQLLAEAFQKEGLDAGFWLPKMSQILGIKCREALQHLEYEDYLKLECEVRHSWEKKALKELLNITDDKTASKELKKEHLENTKQWQEVAKQALKGLTEMINSHSHSQDALRKKAETLWQAMEIPKEFWPSPKKPLAEMLESIHKQLEQQQELSAGRRENIPDTEVLRRASGGLALQGIYTTSRAGDVLATREQLLRVPEGFQLAGPEQGSVLARREFSSSAEESNFTKSMEQLGFSMSVSAKFAFLGMNLGVGVDHSSSSQSQKTHQSHSEQSYFCTTKFQYIPLASCYFQRHQLHLSDAALRELQDMEKILGVTGKEDNPTFVNMCESFFSRFGSHINQGPLHFGGIFWWKASTEGFRAEQREEVKQQTYKALNCFVGASWGGFGASAAGALDVSKSSSQASVQGSAQQSSDTAIQLYMVNTGGPADTTSLPQWKTGLVSDNTTWRVIDRGFELIPVWDVILCNHCGDFKSVKQMSRALRDVYKALTNESVGTIFEEELGSAVQEARDFMENVKASFKNSLEIAAYRKLESAFSEWTWRLRSHFLDVQMRLNNKIQNGDLQNFTRKHLEGLVQETSDAIEKEVEKYFREDKDRETLVQWKSSTELKMKELKETLLHETKKKCENLIELQKEQRKLDARKLEYEAELLRRSRELSVILKGKSLSERELKDNFTLLWSSWIAEISRATHPPEWVDIDAEMEDVLLEHFKEPDFHERIRSFSKDRGFSFDMKKHIMHKKYLDFIPDSKSIYTSHVNRFQHLKLKEFLDLIEESRRILNADVIKLQHITDDIIARVKANIDKKEQDKQDYSQHFFHEILNEVQRGVESVPSDEKWTFNREYSINLSLYLCKMAAERFNAMQEAFQKENDPVLYLSSKRKDFFQCFQISYRGATSITTFADFLCDKIEPALRKAVFERTAKDIAEDMKSKFPDFRGNRANLEVCILRYLAEQEIFEYFKQYLMSPKQFFQKYIAIQVQTYCSDGSRRLEKFLDSSLNLLYQKILSAVSLSTQILKDRKDRQDKISLWLNEFCRELTEVINLPSRDLKVIEHQEVTDIKFLSSAMVKALAAMTDRLKAEFPGNDLSSFSRQPHTILAEHFSGCWKQCPFCGAVCTNTMRDHKEDHQLFFHLPQALMGTTWPGTDHLVIENCSSLLATKLKSKFDDSKWTSYKRYPDTGPPVSTWNILPDSSTQVYWKWFVSHFRTELEDLYNGKFQGKGEIPEAWQRITKQEALSELESSLVTSMGRKNHSGFAV